MSETLKLMCILAHPDDEPLGTGGILAKYGAEDVETYLITATRGEHGWMGDEKDDPGPEALASCALLNCKRPRRHSVCAK